MDRRASLLAVIVSAACFGTLGVLTTLAYRYGIEPLPLLAWRFAFVAALLAAYQAWRDAGSLAVGPSDLGRYSVLSLSGYGAASICFFYALRYASPAVVGVLLYTYPAMVAVVSSVFMRERFTPQRASAIALTFIGCAFVVGLFSATGGTRVEGILLGLGAAAGYTVFNLFSHRWMGRQPRAVLMTYTFGISSVAIAVLTVLAGQSLSPYGWPPQLWALMAAIVLVPSVTAVVLYLRGIQGLGPSQAAIVSTFEPLFTILLAAVVLGQSLTPAQAVGAALVLGGVVLAEWGAQGVRAEEVAVV